VEWVVVRVVTLRSRPAASSAKEGIVRSREEADAEATLTVVRRFIESVGRHDVEAILADMTDDAVYENLGQDVDSGRHEGQAAVRAAFEAVFEAYPDCRSETDDLFAAGDRCCYCWTMRWTEPDGSEGVSRGTDVFTVRAGKVATKKTYE
jgi:ketosteroid isomerase-like protein